MVGGLLEQAFQQDQGFFRLTTLQQSHRQGETAVDIVGAKIDEFLVKLDDLGVLALAGKQPDQGPELFKRIPFFADRHEGFDQLAADPEVVGLQGNHLLQHSDRLPAACGSCRRTRAGCDIR